MYWIGSNIFTGATTFSITILSIAAFSIKVSSATLSIKDLSATFSMKGLLETLSKKTH
jgi:hypothetical protein